ncbi:MAG: hypothetical protein ACXWFI_12925, partial [Methylobacter sp.]
MSFSINSPLNRNSISSFQLSQQRLSSGNAPAQQRLSGGHIISNDAEDTGVTLTLSKEGIAAAKNPVTTNSVATDLVTTAQGTNNNEGSYAYINDRTTTFAWLNADLSSPSNSQTLPTAQDVKI